MVAVKFDRCCRQQAPPEAVTEGPFERGTQLRYIRPLIFAFEAFI